MAPSGLYARLCHAFSSWCYFTARAAILVHSFVGMQTVGVTAVGSSGCGWSTTNFLIHIGKM